MPAINRIPTIFTRLLAVFTLALCILTASDRSASAQQARFDGVFLGLDDATGLTLQLQDRGQEVAGRIAAPDGSGQNIKGRKQNGAVSSELIFKGKRGNARFIQKSLGISMVWTPSDGSSGDVVFAFRRQGLELPRPSAGYQPPPPPGVTSIEPSVFLHSYEFWEPDTVARIYDSIDEKYRALIRIFPIVHTDLIWKLCQSTTQPRELGQALRGEGVTCAQVDRKMKAAQKSGAFNAFKRRVHAQREHTSLAVECARGMHNQSVCTSAARQTQAAATALETVSTVLRSI